MAKTTRAELQNEGWRNTQFGGMASAAFDTFLDGVVTEAGAWAQAKIGAATYDAVTAGTHAHYALARAERYFAGSLLWKRRAGFADSQATNGLQGSEYLNRREYLASAKTAMECALDALTEAARELGVDLAGAGDIPAMASGYIETGRYSQTSTAALND